MRVIPVFPAFLLWSFLLGFQHTPRFRVETNVVKVPVSVFDETGRVIQGMKKDQFRLFDQGEPRPIENFLLDKTPISVVLLLDVSGSVREELEEIKKAAVSMTRAFDKNDRIAVVSFSDHVELLQDWTNNRKDLQKSLKKLQRGYRTALYDALFVTARERLRSVGGKKVIILLTDGLDNQSLKSYDDVINSLIETNTALYIISRTQLVQSKIEKTERVEFLNQVMRNVLKDPNGNFVDVYFKEKQVAMTHLAEATGGRAFFPKKLEELSSRYVEVANELKTQYVLTFKSPEKSEKKFRGIQVKCTVPVGSLSYRRQYLWRAPSSSADDSP